MLIVLVWIRNMLLNGRKRIYIFQSANFTQEFNVVRFLWFVKVERAGRGDLSGKIQGSNACRDNLQLSLKVSGRHFFSILEIPDQNQFWKLHALS